jgi:hypothetical protein
MSKIISSIVLASVIIASGCSDPKVDKILAAQGMARSMCNYPDTCTFSFFDTPVVDGNKVTLTFTAKNAFGVPETNTVTFDVGY